METKIPIVFVIFALIFANNVNVHAHTYTCEEGKFQIDVPEGWLVEDEYQYYIELVYGEKLGNDFYLAKGCITIHFGNMNDSDYIENIRMVEGLNSCEKFTLFDLYEHKVREIVGDGVHINEDRNITNNEALNVNVELGFVIKYDQYEWFYVKGYFVKDDILYVFSGDYGVKSKDDVIKVLNSFTVIE